jgi:hypothetical protein
MRPTPPWDRGIASLAGLLGALASGGIAARIVAVHGYAAPLVLFTAISVPAAQYGTEEEAKAMLDRAVSVVKEDKAKALEMFSKGEGGFKDRDLYVWCANASDGIMTAHPYGNKGKQLRFNEICQNPPSMPVHVSTRSLSLRQLIEQHHFSGCTGEGAFACSPLSMTSPGKPKARPSS